MGHLVQRHTPKLAWKFGFGTETDGKRSFGLFSVSVAWISKIFGFGRNPVSGFGAK